MTRKIYASTVTVDDNNKNYEKNCALECLCVYSFLGSRMRYGLGNASASSNSTCDSIEKKTNDQQQFRRKLR